MSLFELSRVLPPPADNPNIAKPTLSLGSFRKASAGPGAACQGESPYAGRAGREVPTEKEIQAPAKTLFSAIPVTLTRHSGANRSAERIPC